jgi:hypothetical protein
MDEKLVDLLKDELESLTHRARHIQHVLDDFGVEPQRKEGHEEDVSQAQHIRNILAEHATEGITADEVKRKLGALHLDVSANYMYAVLRRAKQRNGKYFPAP